MVIKPALSFGQACYIVNEAERSLNDAGIPLKRYIATRTNREMYEQLTNNEKNQSPDYTIENGGQLSLMDDFFKDFPFGDKKPKIKSLDVLKLQIDDVGNALRRIEFDGLLTNKVKEHIKELGFYDLYEGNYAIQNPSIRQWVHDICSTRTRRTSVHDASVIHSKARNLKP